MSELNFDPYNRALARLDSDLARFEDLDRYYRGAQPMEFLHPDLRRTYAGRVPSLVVNIPRKVVDSIEDRLDVEGFRLRGDDRTLDDLWDIWQANGLDTWSQQGHLAALVHGRSFALVGENPDDLSTPLITVESSAQIGVRYDPQRRRIVSAVKRWAEGDETHATFFGLDCTYQVWAPTAALRSGKSLGEWQLREAPIPNVLGVVPVVPFVNRPDLLRPFGESEMTDVLSISDAINKLCFDMMMTAESHAAPRRWATGLDLGVSDAQAEVTSEKIRQRWEQARADKVWVSDSTETTFGQFPEASLENFVVAINALTAKAAAMGNLPAHYIGHVTENPSSADAIRSAEAPLVKQAKRKQRGFGESWEEVMRLALLVRDGARDPRMASLETVWRNPETPTVAQMADALSKLTGGRPLIDVEQAQEDAGYSPVQRMRMRERALLLPPQPPPAA